MKSASKIKALFIVCVFLISSFAFAGPKYYVDNVGVIHSNSGIISGGTNTWSGVNIFISAPTFSTGIHVNGNTVLDSISVLSAPTFSSGLISSGTITGNLVGNVTGTATNANNLYDGTAYRSASAVTGANTIPVADAIGSFIELMAFRVADAFAFPSSGNWLNIAYGNGQFVSVQSYAQPATSPDGKTWTARAAGIASNQQWAIAYGKGMFVITGMGPTTQAYSSPDGITWTSRTLPGSGNWLAAAWGNGMFVALAMSQGIAASSPDGITWTLRAIQTGAWEGVTYGGGRFVAVPANSGQNTSYSTDGITWNAGGNLPSIDYWRGPAYGNGLFVTIAQNKAYLATSPDGTTWTQRNLPSSASWTDICYGGGIFLAISPTTIAFSVDGINWHLRTMSLPTGISRLAYGNGVFVATDSIGAVSTVFTAATF